MVDRVGNPAVRTKHNIFLMLNGETSWGNDATNKNLETLKLISPLTSPCTVVSVVRNVRANIPTFARVVLFPSKEPENFSELMLQQIEFRSMDIQGAQISMFPNTRHPVRVFGPVPSKH